MRSSPPALSSTRLKKVVVYFGQNHFVPLSSNCSLIKVSHYMYLSALWNIRRFRAVRLP